MSRVDPGSVSHTGSRNENLKHQDLYSFILFTISLLMQTYMWSQCSHLPEHQHSGQVRLHGLDRRELGQVRKHGQESPIRFPVFLPLLRYNATPSTGS